MEMTFDEWIQLGFDNGWVGPPVCVTHDGFPSTASEDEEFETGDPCQNGLRLYGSPEEKRLVEENHAPSLWRASNVGLGSDG
jgi:hypothetical protein